MYSLALPGGLVCFLFLFFVFMPFLVWLLASLCIRPVYSLGPLVPSFC